MDIYEKLNDRYAELASAGYNLDDGTRNDIVAEYQSRWDDGESFVNLSAIDMFLGAKREADTEEELAACVDELAERIKTALVEQWGKPVRQSPDGRDPQRYHQSGCVRIRQYVRCSCSTARDRPCVEQHTPGCRADLQNRHRNLKKEAALPGYTGVRRSTMENTTIQNLGKTVPFAGRSLHP